MNFRRRKNKFTVADNRDLRGKNKFTVADNREFKKKKKQVHSSR